jgi:hypothetical protein
MEMLEAKLSRVLQHINDDEICFISACRNENSNKENEKYTEELATDIRSLGYSYITILGGFTENQGTDLCVSAPQYSNQEGSRPQTQRYPLLQ